MNKGVPSRTVGLALLVIGLAIGAGLVFTLNFAYDVLTPRTLTTTWTETSIVVITVPGSFTTAGQAQIEANVTSCGWSGTHEYCEVALTNTGNLGTATTGNCSLSYGGHSYPGYTGPTVASSTSPGAPQQLIPGKSPTVYCQASTGGAAGSSVLVTGKILLADGTSALFFGIASS